jgi:hypothetical protein
MHIADHLLIRKGEAQTDLTSGMPGSICACPGLPVTYKYCMKQCISAVDKTVEN